jgi:HAMP domain-containing protein
MKSPSQPFPTVCARDRGFREKASRNGAPPLRTEKFGIKLKLSLAVSCLAALTAVASLVGWYVFGNIGHSVTRVTEESLPGIVAALELAEKSNEIAIAVPGLVASRTQEDRIFERASLTRRMDELAALIQGVGREGTALEAGDRLISLEDALREKLTDLDSVVERRLYLQADIRNRHKNLARIHEGFLGVIEPLVDDAVFDLVMTGERVSAENASAVSGLVEGGVTHLDHLLTLNAEINLIAGLLAEGSRAEEAALIEPVRESFHAATASVLRNLGGLPASIREPSLERQIETLLAFGQGPNGAFERRLHLLAGGTGESAAERNRQVVAMKVAHERVLLTLTPLIDDAAFDLVLSTEQVTRQSEAAVTGLIEGGAHILHLVLTVRSETNLAAGLLNQGAFASEESLLLPLGERFAAAEGQVLRMLGDLPSSLDTAGLRNSTAALLELGKGSDSLFVLRSAELRQQDRALRLLAESRDLTARLNFEVERWVEEARVNSREAALRSSEAISGGKLVMIALSAAALLGAASVMFLYVGPRVIQPLEDITGAMSALAAGDTTVDIPGRDRRDELGRMAQALGVFRDTAVEVQASNLREIQETRRRLSDAIESISEAFSLYDADDRLVVCNSKYRSLLYPGIAEEIVPGMTFEAIVRRAIERGYIKDAQQDPETWLAARVKRHRDPDGPHVQQRGDGRWILVSERKTEDGGTVAVYSDITELKQRERELADKSNTLEQLSSQLAKYLSPQVYESIFEGRQEVKLNSKRKKLTVFFSDIAGFTETADRLESEELTQLLNHYLTEMSRIALDHGATIDKYVGESRRV